MTWNRLIHEEDIFQTPLIFLEKTDDYILTITDLGKCISMTSALDKTFTLPDVDITYLGIRVRCFNMGSAKLTIYPHAGGNIEGGSEISSITQYSFVELVILGVNSWGICSVEGQIVETNGYYGAWLLA